MPCTDLVAKVKKIDITNKVASDNWSQTITITLSDIELNDENLIAIRKFRPHEDVKVHIQSLQLSMEEVTERQKLKELYPTSGEICPINHDGKTTNIEAETINIEDMSFNDDDALFDLNYEENLQNPEKVLKSFDFSNI